MLKKCSITEFVSCVHFKNEFHHESSFKKILCSYYISVLIVYIQSCGSNSYVFHWQYCTNVNKCYCEVGWTGTDCSIQLEVTTPPLTTASVAPAPSQDKGKGNNLEGFMKKNVTPYGESVTVVLLSFIRMTERKNVSLCECVWRRTSVSTIIGPYLTLELCAWRKKGRVMTYHDVSRWFTPERGHRIRDRAHIRAVRVT